MSEVSRLKREYSNPLDSSTDEPIDWRESDGWNECLYCGEAVRAPALYCSEEHAEGRSME
jgi:hypothetical protein